MHTLGSDKFLAKKKGTLKNYHLYEALGILPNANFT